MSLLDPDASPTVAGRIRRFLSAQSERIWSLHRIIHHIDQIGLVLGLVGLIGLIKSEWIPKVPHDIAIVLFAVYLVFRALFLMARHLPSPAQAPVMTDESTWSVADTRGIQSGDCRFVVETGKDSAAIERDLETAVQLCHRSLGFEHTGFTVSARTTLYREWIRANPRSILLITPTFGRARGQAVGVTIVLPLKPGAVDFIGSHKGGVLKLTAHHIYGGNRKEIRALLIDTLLLDDQWIPAYGVLALKALFQHVAVFYHRNYWNNIEIYCAIYQAGRIGRSLTRMRQLITKRGFTEAGKTAEAETLFRLPIGVLRADPRLKDRYALYTGLVRHYAEIWRQHQASAGGT
jgi:hypothetical protein